MTKRKYKYKKTLKRKRGGAALLKGITAMPTGIPTNITAGIKAAMPTEMPQGIPSLNKAMGQLEGMPLSGMMSNLQGDAQAKLLSGINGKMPKTIYIQIAEFFLKQYTKVNSNLSLAKKLFKSPSLKPNKYKNKITELNQSDKENLKCACKLIYLYFYDEYADKYSFMIDNPDNIDNICKLSYIINEQILLYNSSNKKKLSNFNEAFCNNNNFIKLYNAKTTNCDDMINKIKNLFKTNKNDNSYIILDLLYDLLNESDILFINIMNELKQINERKKCNIEDITKSILDKCEIKTSYEKSLKVLNPI